VSRKSEGSDSGATNPACPLHCRSGNGSSNAPADQVAWAGLPVNLDFAFSENQRDKVYAQYLKRRRGAQRSALRDISQVCVCEMNDHGYLEDLHRSVSNL
jgi:hypothetical protein